MYPTNQFVYSTEDFEIQGILSKELKEQWLTKHSKFAPIKEFESPESPPPSSPTCASMSSPRYSPISPALPRYSGYSPISNCSPISSNPSRYSSSESSDDFSYDEFESSDESSEDSNDGSKSFAWTTYPSPTSCSPTLSTYSPTSPTYSPTSPSPSKYSTISDADSPNFTSTSPCKVECLKIRDDLYEMSVNEFYNPKGDYSETWHKPEEIIYPEPMDEDNGCVKDIMEKDLDDIDQNLEWLKPNKSSTQEIYFVWHAPTVLENH